MISATIPLEITGLGVLLYSPWAVRHIRKGDDYLKSHYWEPEEVLKHVYEGSLVGIGTGSPGQFVLELRSGYPEEPTIEKAEFKLRLGIRVEGDQLCLRDLYDLSEWEPDCPANQTLKITNGIYHVTVFGDRPPSGILGDHQTIWIFLNPLDQMPALRYEGVPSLA
jgi:hypothetical protein